MATQRRSSQKNITPNDKVLTVETENPQVQELKTALEQSQQQEKSLQETIETSAAQVQELKTTLEQSQQQEKSLQETLRQLKAQIEDHDAIVQHLQANLNEAQQTALKLAESNQSLIDENKQLRASAEKLTRLEAELEQAKQAAVQLAESNQSLIDENKTLKDNQAAKPKTELAKVQSEADLRSQQDLMRKRQAATLAHPVFQNNSDLSKTVDQDIGWFD